MDSGIPPDPPRQYAAAGRIPLAVVVVDGDGLVSHWSSGAWRLFGHSREEAVGQPACDLMPVAGGLACGEQGLVHGVSDSCDELGPQLGAHSAYPTAGRARVSEAGRDPLDVIWWSYPLAGHGPGRHLVLSANAGRLRQAPAGTAPDSWTERIAPGFAPHTEFPEAEALAGRLADLLPNMSPAESTRISSQVLGLGYPVLELSHHDRIPGTADGGVPRRVPSQRRARPTADPVS